MFLHGPNLYSSEIVTSFKRGGKVSSLSSKKAAGVSCSGTYQSRPVTEKSAFFGGKVHDKIMVLCRFPRSRIGSDLVFLASGLEYKRNKDQWDPSWSNLDLSLTVHDYNVKCCVRNEDLLILFHYQV